MTTEVSIVTDTGSDGAIVRLVTLHAVVITVPVLLVALLVVPFWLAIPLAVLVGVAATAFRLQGMDDRVAAALGAVPADGRTHARLLNLVEHLSMAVGVTAPRVHVLHVAGANAVVWGSGGGPASVAATTGLLEVVDRVELEAVVAHLLVQIRDDSTAGPTVAAALFGRLLPGPVARLALRSLDDRHVVATDLEAARVTRYPPGAVAALQRLQNCPDRTVPTPVALRPLWIVDPVDGGLDNAFALHPPLADRIDLLREP